MIIPGPQLQAQRRPSLGAPHTGAADVIQGTRGGNAPRTLMHARTLAPPPEMLDCRVWMSRKEATSSPAWRGEYFLRSGGPGELRWNSPCRRNVRGGGVPSRAQHMEQGGYLVVWLSFQGAA